MITLRWIALLLLATACSSTVEYLLYDFASEGIKGWTGISHQDLQKLNTRSFSGSMEWRTDDGLIAFIVCSARKSAQYLRSPLIGWQKNAQISVVMSGITDWQVPDAKQDGRKLSNCTAITLMYTEMDANGVMYDSKLIRLVKIYSGDLRVNLTTNQRGGQFILATSGCSCVVIRDFRVYTSHPPDVDLSVMDWDGLQIGIAATLGLLACGLAMGITFCIHTKTKATGKTAALNDRMRLSVIQLSADSEVRKPEGDHREVPDRKTEDLRDLVEISYWLDNLGFYCYYANFLEFNIKSWQDVFDLTYDKLKQMGIKMEHQSVILLNITVLKSRRRFYNPTPWYGYI